MSSLASLLPWARKVLSALICGFYGFAACGFAGFFGTIFPLYGLGGWFTAPAGFALGASTGWKTPLRDAVLLFSGWVIGWYLGPLWGRALGGGPLSQLFGDVFAQALTSSLGGWAAFALARKYLPPSTRFDIAAVLAGAWAIIGATYLYLWLYVWEP